MRVMRIRNVRVRMQQRFVAVPVAVLARGHRVVDVQVVAVVVAVGVLVLERVVGVLVCVRFREMERHAGEHQCRADGGESADGVIAQSDRECRADERREGEHRPGARWASRYRRRLNP